MFPGALAVCVTADVASGAVRSFTGTHTVAQDGYRLAILMPVGQPARGGLTLRGRRDECAVLDRLVDGAPGGRSGALVVRGEAGVGKTALLDYAIGSASDLRIVRASGVESEMELAFA